MSLSFPEVECAIIQMF